MECTYHPFNLKFRYPFTISKGTKTHQPTLIVQLEHYGYIGYGEAPAISYYSITVEDMMDKLAHHLKKIEAFNFVEPERFWHFLHHLIPNNPFLVCALDIAGWDIWGKMAKKPLYKVWKGDIAKNPLTNYTIGIDDIDVMVQKMKANPWPIYKIKVGTQNDIDIVKAIRDNTDAILRVDANAAWSLDAALQMIPQLEKLGVQMVEQPLAKDDWEGMKILYKESPLPLFADESCVLEKDVEKCAEHFHGINIKLTKCSGITPALEMIKNARKLHLKVMLGCMNESTIGSAAIAHLLPFVDYVDMDGPLLLEEDVATGINYDNGKIVYSGAPGLGVEYKGLFSKK